MSNSSSSSAAANASNDSHISLNPYLHGMYRPVSTEQTRLGLPVIGEVPKDLYGCYVRNGPNPVQSPSVLHHWFDGDGMMHALWFEDGRVEYRNRYVRSQDFIDDLRGDCPSAGVMLPATGARPEKPYKDTANTDVILHNGQLLGLWYISGHPVRVDPRTSTTLGEDDFGGQLPGHVSAHSKTDPRTGELIFFDYGLYEPWMSWGVVDANNRLKHFDKVALPGPRLPHDMAFTENHVILHDLPVVFTEQALQQKRWSIEVRDQPARFGVVPKYGKGSEVRWFETDPCYIYHVINAWEDGDEVVMQACKMVPNPRQPNSRFGPYTAMVHVLSLHAVPCEWRMNLRTGQCHHRQLDDRLSEFPSINLDYSGRASRFAYIQSIADSDTLRFDGFYKYDLLSGHCEQYRFERNMVGSEVAFAPRPGGSGEDDGWLIGFCSHTSGESAEARIWQADDLAAGPIARIPLPCRVPAGFHATWADGRDIDRARGLVD